MHRAETIEGAYRVGSGKDIVVSNRAGYHIVVHISRFDKMQQSIRTTGGDRSPPCNCIRRLHNSRIAVTASGGREYALIGHAASHTGDYRADGPAGPGQA